jgi:hypothetical protein
MEVGGDARGRSADRHAERIVPVAFRYVATSRVALDVWFDALVWQVAQPGADRSVGFGDVTVGGQWVASPPARGRPTVALAFLSTLPTAAKAVGSGTTDHSFSLLLSQGFGSVDLEATGGYLNVGDQADGGRRSGISVAAAVSQAFQNKAGYIIEVSHQTEEGEVPKGTYALGALTYRLSPRARLDAGLRIGVSSDAPEISVVAGLSMGMPLRPRSRGAASTNALTSKRADQQLR